MDLGRPARSVRAKTQLRPDGLSQKGVLCETKALKKNTSGPELDLKVGVIPFRLAARREAARAKNRFFRTVRDDAPMPWQGDPFRVKCMKWVLVSTTKVAHRKLQGLTPRSNRDLQGRKLGRFENTDPRRLIRSH